jgi:hypothetical protein
MSSSIPQRACAHCGSADFIRAKIDTLSDSDVVVRWWVENVQKKFLGMTYEGTRCDRRHLMCDLCMRCGTVGRLYVELPEEKD